MAVTQQNSDLVANIFASKINDSWKVGGDGDRVVFSAAQITEIGDAGSGFRLYKTQQGSVAFLLGMTHLKFTNWGAGLEISMGHERYVKPDGTVVAEDRTAFFPLLDVAVDSSVILGTTLPVTDTFVHLIDSNVTIAVWEVGNDPIPIGATIEGTLAFNQA